MTPILNMEQGDTIAELVEWFFLLTLIIVPLVHYSKLKF